MSPPYEVLEQAKLSSDGNQGVKAVVDRPERSTRELSGVMEMVYVYVGVVVTLVYNLSKSPICTLKMGAFY